MALQVLPCSRPPLFSELQQECAPLCPHRPDSWLRNSPGQRAAAGLQTGRAPAARRPSAHWVRSLGGAAHPAFARVASGCHWLQRPRAMTVPPKGALSCRGQAGAACLGAGGGLLLVGGAGQLAASKEKLRFPPKPPTPCSRAVRGCVLRTLPSFRIGRRRTWRPASRWPRLLLSSCCPGCSLVPQTGRGPHGPRGASKSPALGVVIPGLERRLSALPLVLAPRGGLELGHWEVEEHEVPGCGQHPRSPLDPELCSATDGGGRGSGGRGRQCGRPSRTPAVWRGGVGLLGYSLSVVGWGCLPSWLAVGDPRSGHCPVLAPPS